MTPILRLSSIIATLMTLSAPALAETGFPDGFAPQVGGVAIGDTFTNAKATITDLLPPDIETVERALVRAGDVNRRGTVFSEASALHPITREPMPIAFSGSVAAETTTSNFQTRRLFEKNALSVTVSSPLTGSVVESITRTISYPDPLDPAAMEAKIIETYGPPVERGQFQTFLYAFKDDAPLDTVPVACVDPVKSPRFLQRDNDNTTRPRRDLRMYFEGRPVAFGIDPSALPLCDAAMEIRPRFNRDGNVIELHFTILDHLHMKSDQILLLEDVTAAQTPPQGATEIDDF